MGNITDSIIIWFLSYLTKKLSSLPGHAHVETHLETYLFWSSQTIHQRSFENAKKKNEKKAQHSLLGTNNPEFSKQNDIDN